MLDFITRLFDTQGFPPRWSCGAAWQEEPSLGWLHIGSDLAIFAAYTAIPIVIAYFVLRRRDLPFPRVFWLFVVFIFACGTTHLISAIIFWKPIYRVDGLVKLVTAVASWATVAALVVATPKALRLPGLAKLNDELTHEVEERKQSEAALRQSETRLQENENRLQLALAEREALLTSERSARSEAEHADRLKEEFLSVVSHELRTPLGAILGYSQLLQMGQVKPDEIADTYRAIERNGKAQVQIIDDILDMSRIIAGKIRLDVRPIQLSEVVEAAIATIRPAAAAKNIRLQQVLDPSSGPPLGDIVLGDFDRLQQVLRNILSNAVKFTPKAGRIQVAIERVNSHLEVSVADSGAGIPPDFLPHVFDRFRQADGATPPVATVASASGWRSSSKSSSSTAAPSLPKALAKIKAPPSPSPSRSKPSNRTSPIACTRKPKPNPLRPSRFPISPASKSWSSTMSPTRATSSAASSPATKQK
jgi:signal transduction histidine kinase